MRGSTPDSIKIPPGQFAFLLTEEEIKVPPNALAWISIRTTYKFRGLINVSGFHVDPGWHGKLIFSVYNAGPAPVHLERGEPLFLILYGDLAHQAGYIHGSRHVYNGTRGRQESIPSELVSNMSGQVFSPLYLEREVGEIKKVLLRLEVIGAIFVSVATSLGAYYFFKQPEAATKALQQPTIVNSQVYATPGEARKDDKKKSSSLSTAGKGTAAQ